MDHSVITCYAPRIYCIDPMLVAAHEWNTLLARVAALEFDHVLLGGTSLADDWFAAADAADGDGAVSAAYAAGTSQADHAAHLLQADHGAVAGIANLAELAQLAQLCSEHQLRLLLDLALPRWYDAVEMLATTATVDPDPLPDPRYPIRPPPALTLPLQQPQACSALLDLWQARLTRLIDAGVAGFCCYDPAALPPSLWQRLIGMTRQQHGCCHFLAWTPGCSHQQLDSMTGLGFDAVFSSAAWWDLRSPWYFREYEKLQAIAPVLGCPEYPFGARLVDLHDWRDQPTRRLGATRALQFAAVSGAGWLLTMGFEYGLSAALSIATGSNRLRTPAEFVAACAESGLDLSDEIRQANLTMLQTSLAGNLHLHAVSAPQAPLLLIERRTASGAQLICVNPQLHRSTPMPDAETQWLQRLTDGYQPSVQQYQQLQQLPPAAVRVLALEASAPVVADPNRRKKPVADKMRAARIAIEQIRPAVEQGRFAVKCIVGEHVTINADIFMDGHEQLAAAVLIRAADQKQWQRLPLQALGNDRWQARVVLPRLGRHYFCIEAWSDLFQSFRDGLQKKAAAGLPLALELEEGVLLVTRLLAQAGPHPDRALQDAGAALLQALRPSADSAAKSASESAFESASESIGPDPRLALLCADSTVQLLAQLTASSASRAFLTRSEREYPLDAERSAAGFASWYELFPRSQSGRADVHGNFDDVIARLPAIRTMGFDTLYLPPIHPIGQRNRKGRNNSLQAQADDPGSPYAIGSADGGHDAIHAQLGNLQDFQRLRDAAAAQGLALALDFAIQCSPDHPWLQEHPEWFAWRPDGSLRYAENPPKQYQDIVNVDFYADDAIPELWTALRDIVLFWVAQGVMLFRVDNPHTKPLPFWEWLIGTVRNRHPEVVFLAEAFTRPKPMYRLAKLGFSQSYTYFTWRHSKQEFIDYLHELTGDAMPAGSSVGLANDPPRDYFRPHFFVNTPDINPFFLQRSGRAGFQIRAALAATLSGLWGVYSGFELCEAQAVPGKEEYLDSEKYEIRAWDWQRPGNIIDDITRLNQIRAENPALQTHLGVRFLDVSNDHILYFVKSTAASSATLASARDGALRFGDNVVLVAINLDPQHVQQGAIRIPLHGFGLPDDADIKVEDLLDEHRFRWYGTQQTIRLDPRTRPYAIWRLHADSGEG